MLIFLWQADSEIAQIGVRVRGHLVDLVGRLLPFISVEDIESCKDILPPSSKKARKGTLILLIFLDWIDLLSFPLWQVSWALCILHFSRWNKREEFWYLQEIHWNPSDFCQGKEVKAVSRFQHGAIRRWREKQTEVERETTGYFRWFWKWVMFWCPLCSFTCFLLCAILILWFCYLSQIAVFQPFQVTELVHSIP